ncbi:MAG: cbb3-type cytochrome oxidase assembly protein CcoS [Planctomycetota bacterium]|jgi:cbb3-type cytochrome oxidase maturation protein
MSVLYIVLPLAIVFAAIALWIFIRSVKGGQFDDLDTPPMRMLMDEDDKGPVDQSSSES